MKFFLNVMSSALGAILGGGIIILIFVLIIMGAADSEQITEVNPKSALHLSFNKPIIERGMAKQVDFGPFGEDPGMGLNHLIKDIEKAGRDENIEGIFIDMPTVSGSPSTLLDIRRALEEFKETGKWIIAYDEGYSQGDLFIASVADEMYMYPEGGVDFRGISAELMYFKNMLESLEIEMQIFKGPDNKYKSAVEPLLYDKMSEADREQNTALIEDIWGLMLSKIADSRGLTVPGLNEAADSLSAMMPVGAVENGLIDSLKYRDEVIDILAEKVGSSTDEDDDDEDSEDSSVEDKLNLVSLSDYHFAFVDDGKELKDEVKKKKVAVVYAVGAIESGQGDDQTIGSDRIARALRLAREDEDVKAVVLRVNSPGGSALASDVIWRETQLIKEAGKPFVVSMGDVAASGGYYIACAADQIYANPNTITGSIGVFGILPNMEKMFNNKLGVTFDRVNSNANADIMSGFKSMSPKQVAVVNESVEDIYDQFIGIVAEGRGMNVADVDSVARGRVWSGEDALAVGLVDELGNLEDAIEAAAGLAEMDGYRLRELPEMGDPFEQMMKELTGQAQAGLIEKGLGTDFGIMEHIERFKVLASMKGVQARLPFFIDIN
jgi:protease-4